jgi:predicted membrane protein
MAGKQIDFPPLQKEDRRVAPFMLILSLVCIVVVLIILASDLEAPFIGPWG